MYPFTRWLFVGAPLLLSTTGITRADDVAEIVRMSKAYEAARVAGDVDACQKLILPDATSFGTGGENTRSLLAELRDAAERRGDSGSSPAPVAEQAVTIRGDSAVVTELMSSTRHGGRASGPWRRSIIHVRSNGSWKIAHVHTSDYSRWEKSISAYEEMDKKRPAKTNGVVFVGSSSIRGWKTLVEDFPTVNAIGRGFGGSQVIDSILYAHRVITPYCPRAIVVYAGDNDIAAGKSAERVQADFRLLVDTIHGILPQARVGFIAIKPSLRRWKLWPEMKRANALVADFADRNARVDYLDIATPMLGADGEPRRELFVSDGLHLSAAGYALWTSVVRPWVRRN